MLQDARQFARVSHPHVAAVCEVSDTPDLPCIAMEFIDGLPLALLYDAWRIPFMPAWQLPELLLPADAIAFILASVPKQMKSFFFSGLAYVAVSIAELTSYHFYESFFWPVSLAAAGLLLAMIAWRYPGLFDRPLKALRSRSLIKSTSLLPH